MNSVCLIGTHECVGRDQLVQTYLSSQTVVGGGTVRKLLRGEYHQLLVRASATDSSVGQS